MGLQYDGTTEGRSFGGAANWPFEAYQVTSVTFWPCPCVTKIVTLGPSTTHYAGYLYNRFPPENYSDTLAMPFG